MSRHKEAIANRVGVREFKARATALINEARPLVIEKHGRPVGFYVPLPHKDKNDVTEAVNKLEHTIGLVLKQTGMTEDELVEFMTKDWEESVRNAPSG